MWVSKISQTWNTTHWRSNIPVSEQSACTFQIRQLVPSEISWEKSVDNHQTSYRYCLRGNSFISAEPQYSSGKTLPTQSASGALHITWVTGLIQPLWTQCCWLHWSGQKIGLLCNNLQSSEWGQKRTWQSLQGSLLLDFQSSLPPYLSSESPQATVISLANISWLQILIILCAETFPN